MVVLVGNQEHLWVDMYFSLGYDWRLKRNTMKTKYFLPVLLIVLMAGCGPTQRLTEFSRDLPESASGRYNAALEHRADADALVIKNIDISYQQPGQSANLSGAIKISPGRAILLSLRAPLGIEVSRILYTPDSVTMVDRRNKAVHFADYKKLAGKLPIEFDFQVLQTLFTGNIPDGFRNRRMPNPRTYQDSTNKEMYLGTFAAPRKSRLMDFYGWIYPDIVKPSYLVFYRKNAVEKLKIRYQSYQEEGAYHFPEKVKVVYQKEQHERTLELDLNRYIVQKSVEMDLGIPSSYKSIRY